MTIVIINYVKWEDTVDCYRSLLNCSYANFDVLIVDNGSRNDSVIQLERRCPDARVVESAKNLGYTGGVNFGIRAALNSDPEFVLLLNADTRWSHLFCLLS